MTRQTAQHMQHAQSIETTSSSVRSYNDKMAGGSVLHRPSPVLIDRENLYRYPFSGDDTGRAWSLVDVQIHALLDDIARLRASSSS